MPVMKLPASLPATGTSSGATPPAIAPAVSPVVAQPQYSIRIRDASLVPQGALSAWEQMDIVLRMNDIGKWALTVRADDPLRSVFATRGAGIIVARDAGDGRGAVTVMSGPIWSIERKGRDNYYILGGPTDEWWLKARKVMPQGGRPYMEQALLSTPLRYYRMGEASGTVAADSSGNGVAGSYLGSPTLGAVGAIAGDPATAVTLSGTQYVGFPTNGLPTGNQPWSLKVGVKIASYPGGNVLCINFGTWLTTKSSAAIGINTSGGVFAASYGGDTAATSAISTGAWHHLVATYDGTTLRIYVDGVAGPTATPGPLTVGSHGASIGAAENVSGFANGTYQEAAVWNVALTPAQVAADYAAFSRTHGATDARTGTASTVILGYVGANLTSPVDVDRDYVAMTTAADPGVGTTVTGNARGDELLTLCQQLAASGGDIGFRVLQTSNTALQFSVYQPNDKSANAKFSADFANLFDYAYALAGPQANSVMVWGGGVGAGRTSVRVQDAASIAAWGMVEGLLDARDTSDTATLQQRGTAEVLAQSEQTNLSMTPRDTDSVQYSRDYNLGDIVAVQIDGNTILNKVRSVHLQLANPDQELITPGIGNPTQGEVARWFDAYSARQQALATVQAKLNRLSASQ